MDPSSWDSLLLRPWPEPKTSPAELGLAYEPVRIPTADGRMLAAWFVPAQGGLPRATVVIHTGMEGNIGRYLSLLPWAADNEFNALIYDYQGFGASEGEAAFRNFEADARAVVDYLLSRPEDSAHVLIHLGGSLGSLPALAATAEYPGETVGVVIFGGFFPEQIGGIWLRTFVSPLLGPIGDVFSHLWVAVLPDFMNPRNAIGRIEDPILVIVPENDTIVPTEAQMNFFAALPEPKQLYFTPAAHSPDAMEHDPALGPTILEWARQLDGLLPD
jgi:hypothetical protein